MIDHDQAFREFCEALGRATRAVASFASAVVKLPRLRGRSQSHSRKIWRERRRRMGYTVVRW